MTQLIRTALPEPEWTLGVTIATVLFACGQAASPALTGMLADSTGTLDTVLVAAAATVAAGAALAARQHRAASIGPRQPLTDASGPKPVTDPGCDD